MKKQVYIVICLLFPWLVSCNDWLDVSPKSEIKADELFETEAGFKDALTGLYIGMTDQSVYGANLSWQEIEWMAGQYTETNNSFAELQKCNYESSIAKSFIESVWSKEYNIIAETNLLLESLEENGNMLNPTLYNVIKGEALAIRAMCHFDLLRLFAPSPKADDGGTYIPYVDNSMGTINTPLTVDATLDRIIADLEKASELLLEWDSAAIPETGGYWIDEILNGGFYAWGPTEMSSMFTWAPRYRVHYCAAQAILARVYFYMGRLEDAYNTALTVTELEHLGAFGFDYWLEGRKFSGDVIFGLYNEKNIENYAPYSTVDNPLVLRNILALFAGDAGMDSRFRDQTRALEDGSGYVSIKNTHVDYGSVGHDEMIPVIRKAELYYIICEYLCAESSTVPTEAITLLQEIKDARMDITPIYSITNPEQFLDVVRDDARKEFIGEGQSFYYYKALNIPLFDGADNIDFGSDYYLPIPDSEHVVL